ncbi:hypothetical protein K491DRAFT_585543 [Lophiostoma macrostomum CBS 122681]|uniref:non-specific serine/threonine protein kinase n=1 Tax=Lophiostoma macrostomum CBS 122681 TaxID=1314788 RepID=A0A6A6TTD9_9PLEO|nr:hypothetical protein K491DRAFT_585543 [Lophiostoma macrostomum CBS 122681]
MVSHQSKSSNSHPSRSQSRSAQHASSGSASNTPGHSKKASSSSNPRAPSRDGRTSRDDSAQRAAQDVEGLRDYQMGPSLGKGAFGAVYKALNFLTGEAVAIKQVRTENLGAAELKNIMIEIDLLKNLGHPNIVKYHGSVKAPEALYIILEYCENGSLHSINKTYGKIPENLVAIYMSQILQGLLYLHEQGVIHRDIKGANILTTKEGLVKLADFGVATKANGLDQTSVVGTPYWMAPEVIELAGATTASDIWSLGCTVIELIEGKPPYHKLQPMQALFRIVNDEHPPIPGSASNTLKEFLMECFQKNPTLRISAKRLLRHVWIQSAKRTQSAFTGRPTQYEKAVETVQEWNEALKSPNSLRKSARLASGPRKSPPSTATAAAAPRKPSVNVNLNIPKQRPIADSFRSPDMDVSDNWDDDFAESISVNALHLPHLKPKDNFGGFFSYDRLKAYAGVEPVAEEPSSLDGEATLKSPLNLQRHLQGRVETSKSESATSASIITAPSSTQPISQLMHAAERPEDPKTAFLRGGALAPRHKAAAAVRPERVFREDTIEDYSDLTPQDDRAFEKRVRAMQGSQPLSILPQNQVVMTSSPAEIFPSRIFHPTDLRTAPKSTRDARSNGSVRQRSASSTSTRKMQRSQSEIEIQKYAEKEQEDFSDVFGDIQKPTRAESDSGSEHSGMAMVTSKMASSFIIADDEDIDPFANLEEGLENINLENNVARDRDDRLVKQTEHLVNCLKTSSEVDQLVDIAEQLIQVLSESPDKRNIVFRSHGLLPILEILQTALPNDLVFLLLKIINLIIFEEAEFQESLSFLGGIPIIANYAGRKYPSEIRKEAANFVQQMYQTSTLTLQMFIGCGGIQVLVEFLEEDIDSERDLVLIGVNGVWSVFELQGSTPKNDFCRILSRRSVLYPLSLVLNRVIEETGKLAKDIEGRIVNIFLIFSQAESHVKDLVADRMILKRVLKDIRKMSPNNQVTMLKFIKNLSMLASTHDALQNSNAIDILIELLKDSKKHPREREISNQILNTMYNLCHHNKSRQEEAALSDIIPSLKEVVQQGGPLKEFALPILCELAHSGKIARKMLWDARGLAFYTSMLSDRNWQVTALEAIFVWLQEETARVEQHLLNSNFSTAIVASYTSPELSQSTFEQMLDPLQKVVRLSPPIAASLADPEIFTRTVQKLAHKDPVARVNLLRILRTICDAREEDCTLIKRFGVYDTILHLKNHDPAILVRQMAEDIVRACDQADMLGAGKSSVSRASGFARRPPSSAGARAGSGSSSGSTVISGMTPPTPTSLKTKFVLPPLSPIPSSTTRRESRERERERERIGRSQSTVGMWELQDIAQSKPSLPRSSTALPMVGGSSLPGSRPSTAGMGMGMGGASRPPSRDASSSNPASSFARLEAHRDSNNATPASAASSAKSRLPKARTGRLSEVVSRRRERESGFGVNGEENVNPVPPLPRLRIARQRRETSGGEMRIRRGSSAHEE